MGVGQVGDAVACRVTISWFDSSYSLQNDTSTGVPQGKYVKFWLDMEEERKKERMRNLNMRFARLHKRGL